MGGRQSIGDLKLTSDQTKKLSITNARCRIDKFCKVFTGQVKDGELVCHPASVRRWTDVYDKEPDSIRLWSSALLGQKDDPLCIVVGTEEDAGIRVLQQRHPALLPTGPNRPSFTAKDVFSLEKPRRVEEMKNMVTLMSNAVTCAEIYAVYEHHGSKIFAGCSTVAMVVAATVATERGESKEETKEVKKSGEEKKEHNMLCICNTPLCSRSVLLTHQLKYVEWAIGSVSKEENLLKKKYLSLRLDKYADLFSISQEPTLTEKLALQLSKMKPAALLRTDLTAEGMKIVVSEVDTVYFTDSSDE